ncbi:MAG: hypothetical protein ACRDKS_14850 [Actinomycetota bacterium]
MNEAVDPLSSSEPWESDFASTEMAQLRAALKATPAERLAKLEELIEFARRAGALPRGSQDAPTA